MKFVLRLIFFYLSVYVTKIEEVVFSDRNTIDVQNVSSLLRNSLKHVQAQFIALTWSLPPHYVSEAYVNAQTNSPLNAEILVILFHLSCSAVLDEAQIEMVQP